MFEEKEIANQYVPLSFKDNIGLYIKREDQLHEEISGNKFRKLKYNFLRARAYGCKTILTFGGAFSNHIAATAAAGKAYGFKTIGIIRGEELADKYLENPTLRKAAANGMSFEFISREAYRLKATPLFIEDLQREFGAFYLIPEGGTNSLAVKGCEEILKAADQEFDYICSAVGTGGTLAGLINTAGQGQRVLGFPALKGDFLTAEVRKFARGDQWELIGDYHFGGYAKTTPVLLDFLSDFYARTGILLDPVYTGKMVFGIVDLIDKGCFPQGAKILAIHTGGLQGWNSKFDSELVKI
ncbi:1-aminocyclopropane-1-carboxylate deaminase/D-cysteine desulfhydrase [Flavobacterium sp. JP2137]|uniref:1-aminocyclopropane-1-carboxylate deaminase/D-cysteine desulfhydrase n=1 Tax=Flavobacterium sp. JP2137 TaxID=3414510 RepID=UPI003D300191